MTIVHTVIVHMATGNQCSSQKGMERSSQFLPAQTTIFCVAGPAVVPVGDNTLPTDYVTKVSIQWLAVLNQNLPAEMAEFCLHGVNLFQCLIGFLID